MFAVPAAAANIEKRHSGPASGPEGYLHGREDGLVSSKKSAEGPDYAGVARSSAAGSSP